MNPLREKNNFHSNADNSFGPEDLQRYLKARTPKAKRTWTNQQVSTLANENVNYENDDFSKDVETSESDYLSLSTDHDSQSSEKENQTSDSNEVNYFENINFKLPPHLLKRLAQQKNKSTNQDTIKKTNDRKEGKTQPKEAANSSNLNNNNLPTKCLDNVPQKVSTVRRETVFIRAKQTVSLHLFFFKIFFS